MKKNLLQLIYPTLIYSICIFAAENVDAQHFDFKNLSTNNVSIPSTINCLAQDSIGNLWIGTNLGLYRYDGLDITIFSVKNGLISNEINALAIDAKGIIWIASNSILSKFDGKKAIVYKTTELSVNNNIIYEKLFVVNDTVWWLKNGDVYFVANGKLNYFTAVGKTANNTAIYAEKNNLWLANNGAVYHYYSKKCDTLLVGIFGVDNLIVNDIFKDNLKQYWFATTNGLYKLTNNEIKFYSISNESNKEIKNIKCITDDKNGSLWLGTNYGVINIDSNNIEYYNNDNGYCNCPTTNLFTDHDGVIWLGTTGKGLYCRKPALFTGFAETDISNKQILSVASTKDSLFLGTRDGKLYTGTKNKIAPINLPFNNQEPITALCYTKNATLWLGTKTNGLWIYENNTYRKLSSNDPLFPSNEITAIYQDKMERIWIGFANGIAVFENENFKTIPFFSNRTNAFFETGKDSIFITTKKGVYLFNKNRIIKYITKTIADSTNVTCGLVQNGNLYIGTSGYGIIAYNYYNKNSYSINESTGFNSEFIYYLDADYRGSIWAGTGNGIYKIRTSQNKQPVVVIYSKNEGIEGTEYNNVVTSTSDSCLWMGTTNGVIYYEPKYDIGSNCSPNIILKSVQINGTETNYKNECDSFDSWYNIPYNLRLPYFKNNITFTYQGVSLNGASLLQYRYKLVGIDKEWSLWSNNNKLSYTALTPGNYELHIQCIASSNYGVEPTELIYTFTILAPIYKTAWFIGVMLFAGIITLIIIQYVTSTRKERREAALINKLTKQHNKRKQSIANDYALEIESKYGKLIEQINELQNKGLAIKGHEQLIEQIDEETQQLYSAAQDIAWALNPENNNLYALLKQIENYGTLIYKAPKYTFSVSNLNEKWQKNQVPIDICRQIVLIFKDAFYYNYQYAYAEKVSLVWQQKKKDAMQIILKYEGENLQTEKIKHSLSFEYMLLRAEQINAKLYIDTIKDKSMLINLIFKIDY